MVKLGRNLAEPGIQPFHPVGVGIINSSARMLTLKFLLDTQHLESNDSRIWIEAGLVT